ncbi:MAG: hypothetical protein SNH80_02115 [Rikenellaceae bacterium]
MTIIHYTLGTAPERSGGLTHYSTDLIAEQQRSATVVLLYAQGWQWHNRDISWRRVGKRGGIECYALQNSLPLPLRYGVHDPADFISTKSMSQSAMESLYNEIKPDAFHVHTLMGLPKELLIFFKSKGVKLVYTAHDYYGICPKVNMIDHNGEVCNTPSPQKCRECNRASKSTLFLRLYNSKIGLLLKNYVKARL